MGPKARLPSLEMQRAGLLSFALDLGERELRIGMTYVKRTRSYCEVFRLATLRRLSTMLSTF